MTKERKYTPEEIESLKDNEIFVFGSNLNGAHIGGAAKTAVEKFGAIMGQAEGLQGQAYAIPTLGKDLQKLSLVEIGNSIDTLYAFANDNPNLDFYVTKIACGIAGFSISEIADIFKLKYPQKNIILPKEFCIT